jgi:hypothetical protein
VIETESQAVLNNLTEHNFQDAFKKWRSVGNGAYTWKGTSRAIVASRLKVSLWLEAPIPEIMDSPCKTCLQEREGGGYHTKTRCGMNMNAC